MGALEELQETMFQIRTGTRAKRCDVVGCRQVAVVSVAGRSGYKKATWYYCFTHKPIAHDERIFPPVQWKIAGIP